LPFYRAPTLLYQEEQDTATREREVRQQVTRRIKTLGQQRKFKEAVQELASLATLGIQPDTQAATALLAACTRSRDMQMAQSVFEQLFGEYVIQGDAKQRKARQQHQQQQSSNRAKAEAFLALMPHQLFC
jgi:hypothetical protein